ncbi:MAG TPA: M48 family metalloprotease [Lacunisphaera sp.]|nr:M48 family metalloprotease [Lacunisphaera sp.]
MSETNPPVPPLGLSLGKLTLPKEGTYFVFVLVISILFWALLAISIVGIFYALFIGFFVWLGNGLLVAHLRAEAVRVDERQLPELHAAFREVCSQLAVTQPPTLYVVQAGGLLNAFATRFAGRNFVVVYSDFLEALGPSSREMKFILGHELGHIQSRHILKQIFLAPGLFFPLAGPAYRRAWESSCDRYGAFAAQDVEGSVRAMMVLSGGREHGRTLSATVFAGQLVEERGFFVSLHELTSSYPTLSRRVSDLLALKTGASGPRPARSALAYVLALFIPGGNFGGGGGPLAAMVMIVVIGLMAAMAIPAFQKVRQASQQKMCLNNERQLSAAFEQYQLENGRPPRALSQLIGADKYIHSTPVCPLGGTYSIPEGSTSSEEISCSVHGTIQDIQQAASRPPRT